MTRHPDLDRPDGHCESDAAWAEFARQYDGQPRTLPSMSDFALANAVFMADRNDLNLIHYQTAAKERIRWLSLRLAESIARAREAEAERDAALASMSPRPPSARQKTEQEAARRASFSKGIAVLRAILARPQGDQP